jgi:hypothetical protein
MLAICIIPSVVSHAQVAGGTISGIIADSSGAVIPGASISVRSQSTGAQRAVTANKDGFYQVPNLPAGKYDVIANAAGFNKAIASGVTLTVGATQSVNITLSVGQVTESVDVSTAAAPIDLSTSTVSENVDQNTVVELPLNGRDWTTLATLQPGVSLIHSQPQVAIDNHRGNRGLGTQLTVSGSRPQQNNYRVDGISINDYSNGAPGSVLGVNLGVDAIQEFSVITSNPDAQYGKTSAGVINAVSRSGSNQFHGAGYEFLRNSALDARNYFDGPNAPSFKRNQFGASVGGPIQKDKTFIFGDYEGLRQGLGTTFAGNNVPSKAARNGILCSLCANPVQVNVDPSIAKFLALYPLPNGPLSATGDSGPFSFASQQVSNEDFFTVRTDHKFNNSDTVYGTYLFDNGKTSGPDQFDSKRIGTLSRRQLVTVEDSHVFNANFLNSVRVGYSRVVSQAPTTIGAINPLAADPSLGALPGRNAPVVNVGGLAQYPGGLHGIGEFDYFYNSYQVYDDAFWTRGNHALKFGFAFERMQNNQLGSVNPNGNFTFPNIQALLTNSPTVFRSPLPGALSPRDLRQSLFGFYLQDDWRVRKNFTVNLGLRYEPATVPTESKGKLTNLVTLTDSQPKLGSPYFQNPTLLDLSPRVGFAWDPFGDGKTSVRGGYGIYDSLPLNYLFGLNAMLSAPFYRSGSSNNPAALQGSFPNGAYPLIAGGSQLDYAYVQQNPGRNYIQQWNVNLQRELPGTFTVLIGYVGSHGLHQPIEVDDFNIVPPVLTSQGYVGAPAGTPSINPNANVGDISGTIWNGTSNYNGMNLRVQKRLSHGVQFQTSYTWAKAIDTGSNALVGDQYQNSIVDLPFYFDPRVRRAPADFDIRRNLTINGLWTIPSLGANAGVGRWITNGWELGGIYQLSSGQPFTPLVNGDAMGLQPHVGDPYDFADIVRSVPGCSNPVGLVKTPGQLPTYIKTQCFAFPGTRLGDAGRNSLYGPGLTDLDMSLFKNTRVPSISETFNIQFRAEIFNLLNHANFAMPEGNNGNNRVLFNTGSDVAGNLIGIPNASAGQITRTTTTSRQIQFGLKFIW